MMRILLPIIALVLIGCGPKPEEMVVGEWKVVGKAEFNLRFRGDGVVEMLNVDPTVMGDWQIVDGKVEARIQKTNGVIQKMFLKIEGIKKILLFKTTIVGGQYENIIEHNPPEPFYRVVE